MLSQLFECFNRLFRVENYPIFYGEVHPKILIDVTLLRIVSVFCAILIAFLIILPGFRGNKKFFVLIRWSCSFLILFFMIFCNFMPYWERGTVQTLMPHRFGSSIRINASLGINIGLRGINVTLIADPIHQHNDTIDFNEFFAWTWSQGKPGYGRTDAGTFQKNYRKAQFRGLPYPVLWVAETFTIDYEHVRIGRYYRQSGWFAHIFLWTAVPLFLLANILFQMVIYYGSLFIIFTGISLLSANIVLMYLRSSIPFALAFDDEFLITHYSWCFYLNLINGALCIMIGITTLIADLRLPDETAEFFGNDVLQSYEDYFADPQEKSSQIFADEFTQIQSKSDNEVLLRKKIRTGTTGGPNQDEEANVINHQTSITRGLKKRTLSERFSRFQKSTIRKTVQTSAAAAAAAAVPVEEKKREKLFRNPEKYQEDDDDDEEMPLYENFHHFNNNNNKNNNRIEAGKKSCENEM